MDKTTASAQIGERRKELDGIDRELVKLFERRIGIARQIGAIKKEANLPVFDASREKDILAARRTLLEDPELGDSIEAFFKLLMQLSKAAQRKDIEGAAMPVQVAYQGIEGSYGYEAAESYFGKGANFVPCKQFGDALEAVVSGRVDYAVLPIENSIAGVVNPALDILINYRCFVVGEVVLPVSHCLLAPEGATIDSLAEVSSHQQALTQCSRFLSAHPTIATRLSENTAVAARGVGERKDPRSAAIASRACADLYGLKVLAEKLQDEPENFTRFIIVSRREYTGDDWNKAIVRFALPHESGALQKVLDLPAELDLNLTNIVSRPYPGKSFQYFFYLDMVGAAPQVEECLKRMSEVSVEWALLGRFPSAEVRPTKNAFEE